jgi:hypothetical protein
MQEAGCRSRVSSSSSLAIRLLNTFSEGYLILSQNIFLFSIHHISSVAEFLLANELCLKLSTEKMNL